MVIAAARHIAARVRGKKISYPVGRYRRLEFRAWLATYLLRQEDYEIDVMAEVGFFGYLPRPADPFIFNVTNIPTCKMLTDISEVLGMFVGGFAVWGS